MVGRPDGGPRKKESAYSALNRRSDLSVKSCAGYGFHQGGLQNCEYSRSRSRKHRQSTGRTNRQIPFRVDFGKGCQIPYLRRCHANDYNVCFILPRFPHLYWGLPNCHHLSLCGPLSVSFNDIRDTRTSSISPRGRDNVQ